MKIPNSYLVKQLTLADLDAVSGPLVLEFGTNWCPHCQAAQVALAAGFADYPDIPYFKIEDGKGRRLGRHFQVKLWPTIIFLAPSNIVLSTNTNVPSHEVLASDFEGKTHTETARLVRPLHPEPIKEALAKLLPSS